MERVFHHEITYDFDDDASIEEITASLLANARFVRDAIAVIEACHPSLEISECRVRLVSLSQESPLKELLAVALVLGFQSDLEEEVPDFIKALTGIEVPDQYDSMVTIFVMGISLYAALVLIERIYKGRKSPRVADAYDSATRSAGEISQVDGDKVAEKIEQRMGGRRVRSTARAARDFFMPAKRHKARSISSSSSVTIGKDVLDEIPSELDESMLDERRDMYDLERVTVKLRAHDLDREKSGWASVIEEVSPNRVKTHKDPSIPAATIFTKPSVIADVRVHLLEDDEGEMVPELYVLLRVHHDDAT